MGEQAAAAGAGGQAAAGGQAIRPEDVIIQGWKCPTCGWSGNFKSSLINSHEKFCLESARRAAEERARAEQEAARLAASSKGKGDKRWAARDRRYGGK